jgi:hypothetical protein
MKLRKRPLCEELGISDGTLNHMIKLGKIVVDKVYVKNRVYYELTINQLNEMKEMINDTKRSWTL